MSALLDYKRDGVPGDLNSKLAVSPFSSTLWLIFYILGLVLTNFEPLCIGDSSQDIII